MKRPYFKYVLALLLFGSNGVVASHISLGSVEIVFLRALIGSLLLIAVFLATGGRFAFWREGKDAIYLAASGVAMGASWMFLYEAYRHIGVGVASLAYYCGPVILMALSPVLFREKLTRAKIAGFLAVLVGVFLVNGRAMREGNSGWGLFCGAMSAVTYAIMVIFNKKAARISGLENAAAQLAVSFITVAAFMALRGGISLPVAAADWPPILLLGLVNTGIGCYLYFSSIGRLPVQTVAICGYLEPLSAVAFSLLLLKEVMLPMQIVGAILILGGAIFGECAGGKASRAKGGEVA